MYLSYLEYSVNLYNCIETPLDEKVIAFAKQDRTAANYRDLALQKLKGENVDGYLFTLKNTALERIYHWRGWIQEYEKGFAEGKTKKARDMSLNLLTIGLSVKQIVLAPYNWSSLWFVI